MITRLQRERSARRELFTRLADPVLAATDQTGEDQRLRFRSALRQALFDQELIGPPPCLHLSRSQARAGCAAISRPRAESAIAAIWRALSPA